MVNKLIIEDSGDPTVGIFPQKWEVDIPFSDQDDDGCYLIKSFIESIATVYAEYCGGKMTIYKNLLKLEPWEAY